MNSTFYHVAFQSFFHCICLPAHISMASPVCLNCPFPLSACKPCLSPLPCYWMFSFLLRQSQPYLFTQCTDASQQIDTGTSNTSRSLKVICWAMMAKSRWKGGHLWLFCLFPIVVSGSDHIAWIQTTLALILAPKANDQPHKAAPG